MRLVWTKQYLEKFLSQYFGFPLFSIIQPLLSTHSLVYHRRYIKLTLNSTVKQRSWITQIREFQMLVLTL
jgi:hypothetical protein